MNSLDLFNKISNLIAISKRFDNQYGENFNLISLLGMEEDEVNTHSKIISDLLNPEGSHGQKGVFLKHFIYLIKKTKKKSPINLDLFDYNSAFVKIEHYAGKVTNTQGGRIDIFIQDKNKNIILIENKINAIQTGNQLERYRGSFPSAFIIYLTLFEENSTDANDFINQHITYNYDILKWLDACRKECIDFPILREGLAQYIQLIKKLTFQRNSDAMDEQIINCILENTDNLENFQKLLSYKENVNKKVQEKFLNEVKKLVVEMGMIDEKIELDYIRIKYQCFSIFTENMKSKNIGIFCEFDKNNLVDFYIGIGYFENITKEIEYSEKNIQMIRENNYKHEKGSVEWICYKYLNSIRNWNSDSAILSMNTGKAIEILKSELEFLKDLSDSLEPDNN